ncbi:hypothetical protein EI545_13120 [Tabrizicola piscis]|uniref:Uncharacterized protein n=1 Tax=Tabrizicola piscis TaxID=2494374 RepID=A0A3S8U839_9RHOB|nr:hypothetical protein [Tabrizicola piscis]AZL59690.1 hypothetical protein EI545_13120 [Tabrizicola piscis]
MWHHWVILLATPLVLLRSSESIEAGRRSFDAYLSRKSDVPTFSLESAIQTIFAAAAAYGTSNLLTSIWLPDLTGWQSLWRGVVIGWLALNIGLGAAASVAQMLVLAIAGAMIGAIFGATDVQSWSGISGVSIGAVSGAISVTIVLPFGLWIRAIFTRFSAMIRNPVSGLKSLPENWRNTVLAEDFLAPLELVPGHENTALFSGEEKFPFDILGDRHQSEKIISGTLVAIFLFTPLLIWRWSIKSTAWFYFPYLLLGWGWSNARGYDLVVWCRAYGRTLWNWVALILAILLLASSVAPLIGWVQLESLAREIKENGGPVSPIVGLLVLDWHSLAVQPWYWFYLPSWCLTIFLFLAINKISAELAAGGDQHSRIVTLGRYLWISNLRCVLTNIGLATALFYFLYAIDAWGRTMEFVQSLLQIFAVESDQIVKSSDD